MSNKKGQKADSTFGKRIVVVEVHWRGGGGGGGRDELFARRRWTVVVKGMGRGSYKPFLGVVPFGRKALLPRKGFAAADGGGEREGLDEIGGLLEIEIAEWVWWFKCK